VVRKEDMTYSSSGSMAEQQGMEKMAKDLEDFDRQFQEKEMEKGGRTLL
jgi:hypothetical protein